MLHLASLSAASSVSEGRQFFLRGTECFVIMQILILGGKLSCTKLRGGAKLRVLTVSLEESVRGL